MNDDQADVAALQAAATILDRLIGALDPPDRRDMQDKKAHHRLEQAAQLARERAHHQQQR